MRRFLVLSLIVSSLVCASLQSGCFRSNDPTAPQTGAGPATTGTPVGVAGKVSFLIVLPEDQTGRNGCPLAGIRASATGTPQVTFKLVLVNVGNTTNPTTTLSKTVPVNLASGTAEAEFTGVPALTCIGDVHIDGGKIGSYTDFHGAADLLAGVENTVVIGPKGTKTREDVIAETIRRITENGTLFGKAVPRLVARIATCMTGLNLDGLTIYDDVVTLFANVTNTPPRIDLASTVQMVDTPVSPGGGTVTVSSPTSPINGLEVIVPSGAFQETTNIKVAVTPIASYAVPAEFTPITPMITVDDGGKEASEPVRVKIPATVANGKIPVAVRYPTFQTSWVHSLGFPGSAPVASWEGLRPKFRDETERPS